MAEEVGAGYISLLPSLRGFSKRVKAALVKEMRGVDVTVPVNIKPEIDRKDLAAQLIGKRALKVPVELVTKGGLGGLKGLTQKVRLEPDESFFRKRVASLLGSRSTFTQKLKLETDVDKDALRRTAASSGSALGSLLSGNFGSALLNPVIGIPAVTAAALLSIPLGAAVSAATVAGAGLSAVFLGAFLLKDDPQIRSAVTGLFAGIKATMLEAAQPLKGPFLTAIRLVGEGFRDIAPDIKDFFKTIADSGAIQELGRGFKGFLKSFAETGALKKLAETIGPVLKQLGMALPDIGNALSQFLIEVSRPETIDAAGKIFRGLADAIRITGDIIGWLTGKFDTFVSIVSWVVERVDDTITGMNFLRTAFSGNGQALQELLGIFNGWIQAFVQWTIDLAKKIRGGVSDAVGGMITKAKEMPGKILSALGNTGTLLLNAGKNIVQGLIDGIKSKFAALGNAASLMAGIISNYVPNSPAKMGPLSGSGSTYRSGQIVAEDMAAGIQSQLPTVATAASQLAGTFGMGRSSSGTAPAGSGFTIDTAGSRLDQLLLEILKESIRVRNGGNVTLALGS